MADVRAMLRAERAARGTVTSKSRKQTKQPPPSSLPASGRKRKAGDESVRDIIKRFRAEKKSESPERSDNSKSPQDMGETVQADEPTQEKLPSTDPEHVIPPIEKTTTSEAQQLQAAVDKDEWAAFERDMAAFPPEPSGRSALDAIKSGGTISAAPMTADEVVAQAQEERTRRSRREEEMAEEKEDAAQALEDEFDEMEELEQRAKKLREMREKLREQQTVGNPERQDQSEPQQGQEEEDDEGNVEDDFDDWIKFG